jgi:hypothetical protein
MLADRRIVLPSGETVSPCPRRGVLGYAYPLAPAGINATIYYEHVTVAAGEHGISAGELLGHAIAHEIGHVLLRTASHPKGGLMSGGWNESQFRHIRLSGMYFDKAQSRFMQSAIQGEGCTLTVADN